MGYYSYHVGLYNSGTWSLTKQNKKRLNGVIKDAIERFCELANERV